MKQANDRVCLRSTEYDVLLTPCCTLHARNLSSCSSRAKRGSFHFLARLAPPNRGFYASRKCHLAAYNCKSRPTSTHLSRLLRLLEPVAASHIHD